MIVCIDSMVIVWGIKKSPSPGQESMIAKAEYFFQWADEHQYEIIIPTVVIAEVLAPEPPDIREQYLQILDESFLIRNFDVRAALKYAEILHNRFEEVKAIAKEENVTRQRMKIDHTIIATALVNDAKCIYSYDRPLKKFAAGIIDVKEFPTAPAKPNLLF